VTPSSGQPVSNVTQLNHINNNINTNARLARAQVVREGWYKFDHTDTSSDFVRARKEALNTYLMKLFEVRRTSERPFERRVTSARPFVPLVVIVRREALLARHTRPLRYASSPRERQTPKSVLARRAAQHPRRVGLRAGG
jgi:hypothetical protein